MSNIEDVERNKAECLAMLPQRDNDPETSMVQGNDSSPMAVTPSIHQPVHHSENSHCKDWSCKRVALVVFGIWEIIISIAWLLYLLLIYRDDMERMNLIICILPNILMLLCGFLVLLASRATHSKPMVIGTMVFNILLLVYVTALFIYVIVWRKFYMCSFVCLVQEPFLIYLPTLMFPTFAVPVICFSALRKG